MVNGPTSMTTSAAKISAPHLRRAVCLKVSLLSWVLSSLCCGILLYLFLNTTLLEKKELLANNISAELDFLIKKSPTFTQQQLQRHFESLGKRLNLSYITLRQSEQGEQSQNTSNEQQLPNIQIVLKEHYSKLFSYTRTYRTDSNQELLISADFSSIYLRYFWYFLACIVMALCGSLFLGIVLYLNLTHHVTHPIKQIKQALTNQSTPLQNRELDDEAPNKNIQSLVCAIKDYSHKVTLDTASSGYPSNDFSFLLAHLPAAIWRIEFKNSVTLKDHGIKDITHSIANNGVIAELNSAAEALISDRKYPSPHSKKKLPWRALPFLNEHLFTQMLEQHLNIKNILSEFYDDRQQKRAFWNSLFGVEKDGRLVAIWGAAFEASGYAAALDELEKREKELNLSESRLAQAQALAHMGHWSYETASDKLQVSEEFARIYGFNPIYEVATWRGLIERMHPDDRKYVIDILSDPENSAVGTEHRIIWPNGEERFVQAIASKVIENNRVVQSFGIIMDITSRRRAEQQRRASEKALIESEAKMAEAQAIAHMGHWVLDYSNKQLVASDEFFRLHGYEPQGFVPHVRDFTSLIHPDDKPRIREKLKTSQTKAFTEEYRLIKTDGEVRHMRATVTPYYSGGQQTDRVFGISMDITEQKLAEIELKNSQQQLNKVFQASPDGIFVLNAKNYELVSFNPAFQNMLGLKTYRLLASPLLSLPIWPTQEQADLLQQKMKPAQSEENVEVRFINADDAVRVALLSWKPIDIGDQACLLVNMRDITQLRQLEEKAKQQELKLIQSEKLASLGTMVAGVAHEVNNPNHLIQMNAELLQDFLKGLTPLLNEQLKSNGDTEVSGLSLAEVVDGFPELLSDIRMSSKRIDRIVKDLKDFARPNENSQFLFCDLNQIAKKTKSAIQPLLMRHNISLKLSLADDLPEIMGDANRLQQVLENLISNACEATFDEQGVVTLSTEYQAGSNSVICAVRDHGCGISQEIQKSIFDPFFTTKQNSGGTGLGLAITHSILQEHNAQLEVESQTGVGTSVRFAIPAHQAEKVSSELGTTHTSK